MKNICTVYPLIQISAPISWNTPLISVSVDLDSLEKFRQRVTRERRVRCEAESGMAIHRLGYRKSVPRGLQTC